jgi:hypothetical protein
VSAPLVSYKPNARISESLSTLDPMQTNWGLGVNYETTIRNVSDSTSP